MEDMNIKALQKKAKEVTVNEKTGGFNKRKRFGKSILKRSPGYFTAQIRRRFESTGGSFKKVNTWTFKASQYDHVFNKPNKKQLSKRGYILPDGRKIQRDLYSAFLLYCTNNDLQTPDQKLCLKFFDAFYDMHQNCIQKLKDDRKVVLNSGIKF